MEVLALAIITRLKATNQNTIGIGDTSLEDSLHLSELDRIIKITTKNIKEVEVPPQKLEHETQKLPFQIKDGIEPWKESIERNWEEPKILNVIENPLYRQTRELANKSYELWTDLKKNQSRHHYSSIIRGLFNTKKGN